MIICGLMGGLSALAMFSVLLVFLLPVLALIDIIRNQFEGNSKIVWVIAVLCLPYLGSILYFLIGTKQRLE